MAVAVKQLGIHPSVSLGVEFSVWDFGGLLPALVTFAFIMQLGCRGEHVGILSRQTDCASQSTRLALGPSVMLRQFLQMPDRAVVLRFCIVTPFLNDQKTLRLPFI